MESATDVNSAATTIGNIISSVDDSLVKEKPDALLILGDTNSCLSAISAKRRKIPIFHMEAGNRCFDVRVPEEINRKIVDHTADVNLTYSSIAREYLLREGLPPDLVIKTGSPMYEIIDYYQDNIKNSQKFTSDLRHRKKSKEHADLYQHSFKVDEKSDKLCCWLQIFTSCFSSFAHGSNDVANAIGPLATIYSIYETNTVEKKADVPLWILALGGAGIVFGLSTWGYKIINRLGRDLTKISPSRGFLIELSAATTIIIASRTEMPVSTTHCQVGSIVGCGLTDGKNNVKWSLLKGILFSWFITLPVTGFLSAGLFSWGFYSPSGLTNNTYA